MKTMLAMISLWAAVGALCSAEVSITIYNDNFAVVKDSRKMTFQEGLNQLHFTDVAERIDPTSVLFECVSDPTAVTLLEQNFQYDLVNVDMLLKRYLEKSVRLMVKGSGASASQMLEGLLLAVDGGQIILQEPDSKRLSVVSQASVERIELAGGEQTLLTRPTLQWLAHSKKSGQFDCQVAYTTEGVSWRADYLAALNEAEDAVDFSGWVTIDNQSGATYPQATIKLVAGDVRRLARPQQMPEGDMRLMAMKAVPEAPRFEEKPFMEYHLYTLGRKATLENRQIKQIELLAPVQNVPVQKLLVFSLFSGEWGTDKKKVQVKLEFENKPEYGLGMALPKGRVRVFKKDPADQTLEFVGEDSIEHTARLEKLSLYIGDAFDIVPEHKILDQRRGDRFSIYTRSVQLRNRKPKEPATVIVEETMPRWVNWKIEKSSLPFEKKDAFTVRFKVNVPADSTTELTYTVQQMW